MSASRGQSRRAGSTALSCSRVRSCSSSTAAARSSGSREPWARFVHDVGDFDGSGRPCALIRTDLRTLILLDVFTGEPCWRWQAAAGTYVNDLGGLKVERTAAGATLYLFPTYATEGWCFDFAGRRDDPTTRWHATDLPFDAGFGPGVVLADVDGDGRRELFLSSRTGTQYGRNARAGRTTTAEVVLGRRDGLLWQAVMDPWTGRVMDQVAFEAVPGAPHRCARPYGLLHVAPLAPGERPQSILVSCQVEEFAVLTRRTRDGGWRRRDGWFVEKDWPADERELRPQPSSLADLRGDGRPLLVVGLWQDGRWQTLVLDPRDRCGNPSRRLPAATSGAARTSTATVCPKSSRPRNERARPAQLESLRHGRGGAAVNSDVSPRCATRL